MAYSKLIAFLFVLLAVLLGAPMQKAWAEPADIDRLPTLSGTTKVSYEDGVLTLRIEVMENNPVSGERLARAYKTNLEGIRKEPASKFGTYTRCVETDGTKRTPPRMPPNPSFEDVKRFRADDGPWERCSEGGRRELILVQGEKIQIRPGALASTSGQIFQAGKAADACRNDPVEKRRDCFARAAQEHLGILSEKAAPTNVSAAPPPVAKAEPVAPKPAATAPVPEAVRSMDLDITEELEATKKQLDLMRASLAEMTQQRDAFQNQYALATGHILALEEDPNLTETSRLHPDHVTGTETSLPSDMVSEEIEFLNEELDTALLAGEQAAARAVEAEARILKLLDKNARLQEEIDERKISGSTPKPSAPLPRVSPAEVGLWSALAAERTQATSARQNASILMGILILILLAAIVLFLSGSVVWQKIQEERAAFKTSREQMERKISEQTRQREEQQAAHQTAIEQQAAANEELKRKLQVHEPDQAAGDAESTVPWDDADDFLRVIHEQFGISRFGQLPFGKAFVPTKEVFRIAQEAVGRHRGILSGQLMSILQVLAGSQAANDSAKEVPIEGFRVVVMDLIGLGDRVIQISGQTSLAEGVEILHQMVKDLQKAHASSMQEDNPLSGGIEGGDVERAFDAISTPAQRPSSPPKLSLVGDGRKSAPPELPRPPGRAEADTEEESGARTRAGVAPPAASPCYHAASVESPDLCLPGQGKGDSCAA